MPDVLQFYVLSVHDFNILNLRKKSTFLTTCRLIFQASFFLEEFDRERKIN